MQKAISEPHPRAHRRLKICLAGSGGGHVRQLLDLHPVWSRHDYFFVTEDTAMGRSLAADHRTHFLPHVAIGQAKLGSPWRMLTAGLRNLVHSARIIRRERPDLVISTGAGAMFFSVIFARLARARVVVVESFARFDSPSAFARLAAPLAHHKVVQSAGLSGYWPDAAVFDPLKILDQAPPAKSPLVFATVGATLPFDRLVEMVAQLKARGEIPERVVAQIGLGGARPEGLETVETLPFEEVQDILRQADIVVCHGGTGSLITALRQGCRVIAVPRRFARGEHYDDHQEQITRAFAARGLIAVADTVEELAQALRTVRARPPVMATTEPDGLVEHLNGVVAEVAGRVCARA